MLFVIVIDSSVNVATLILVLEAAVDDHDIIKSVVIFAIHEVYKDAFINTRQVISLILRYKVR